MKTKVTPDQLFVNPENHNIGYCNAPDSGSYFVLKYKPKTSKEAHLIMEKIINKGIIDYKHWDYIDNEHYFNEDKLWEEHLDHKSFFEEDYNRY